MCRFNDSVLLNAWITEGLSVINSSLWPPCAFFLLHFLCNRFICLLFIFACEFTGSVQVVTVTVFAVSDPAFEFTFDSALSLG